MSSNPFVTPEAVVEAASAASTKLDEVAFGKRYRVKGMGAITEGRKAVEAATVPLRNAAEALTAESKYTAASAKTVEALDAAGREFNRAANQLGFAEGKILSSIKGMVKAMGSALGLDTSNIGAGPIKGDVAERVAKTYATKAGLLERVASKPFRVAANNPRAAVAGTALAALAWGGSVLKGRAEKRTALEAQEEMLAAVQPMSVAEAPVSYKNSVSPDEAAMLAARQQEKSVPTHAGVVEAKREQSAQTPVSTAAL